jgi:UDP-glucuronate 4-epimerase
VERFVFASSSSVYGASTKVPFSEADRIDCPVSPYAATKFAGELMCYTYHHLYGLPVTALRFFTAYGPRQRPEMAIHKFTRLVYDGRSIPMFGHGETARDYTYIDDIVQGLMAAIDFPCGYEVFNLGESSTITLMNLVRLIEQISGLSARIDFQQRQPGDVEITYADISKAQRLLDYRPTTPIEVGLTQFISWFRENETRRSAKKVS